MFGLRRLQDSLGPQQPVRRASQKSGCVCVCVCVCAYVCVRPESADTTHGAGSIRYIVEAVMNWMTTTPRPPFFQILLGHSQGQLTMNVEKFLTRTTRTLR